MNKDNASKIYHHLKSYSLIIETFEPWIFNWSIINGLHRLSSRKSKLCDPSDSGEENSFPLSKVKPKTFLFLMFSLSTLFQSFIQSVISLFLSFSMNPMNFNHLVNCNDNFFPLLSSTLSFPFFFFINLFHAFVQIANGKLQIVIILTGKKKIQHSVNHYCSLLWL